MKLAFQIEPDVYFRRLVFCVKIFALFTPWCCDKKVTRFDTNAISNLIKETNYHCWEVRRISIAHLIQ